MRILLAILFATGAVLSLGQWSRLPGVLSNGPPLDLYWDELEGRLYVLQGGAYVIVEGIDTVQGIAYYEQGLWHAMGDGVTQNSGQVYSITRYQDAIVVGGTFWEMDSLPDSGQIAEWRDAQWHPLLGPGQAGAEVGLRTLSVIDGELHALGSQDWDINGTPANGWAIWNGSQWRLGDTIGILDNSWGGEFRQACDYQGQRYVGGNFQYPGQPNDLVRWNGSAWEEVGGGINGDPWVNELVVYDGKLWVAGEFAASSGNAANGLMTWDGVQWANPFPDISFTAQCRDLVVANDKLYFCGPYLAQGMPGTYRFGVFDGEQLCVFGGADLFNADKPTVSADTLYAYCYIDGTNITGISRWPLNGPMDTCYQIVQGVAGNTATANVLSVYPNPAADRITIAMAKVAERFILLDGLGRTMLVVTPDAFGKAVVDVRSLAAGVYHVEARTAQGTLLAHSVFVKDH